MAGAPALARLTTRVQAIVTVSEEMEAMPGLAEADRLGLRVTIEILTEALGALAARAKLTAAQAGHLDAPGRALLEAADALETAPSPAAVAAWWRGLEPAVREFARAVHDLPHR